MCLCVCVSVQYVYSVGICTGFYVCLWMDCVYTCFVYLCTIGLAERSEE